MSRPVCLVTERLLRPGVRAVVMESDLVSVTVLPDNGADIYELRYLPRGIDVLWKSRWGLGPLAAPLRHADTNLAWLERCAGGWHGLFPNAGPACSHAGVEHPFHGEASFMSWNVTVQDAEGDSVAVDFDARLFRSPFALRRRITLQRGEPVLRITERIENLSAEAAQYIWGHHPTFGAPFVNSRTRLETGARRVMADAGASSEHTPIDSGVWFEWPNAELSGRAVDLRDMPAHEEPRSMLAYLTDFEDPWFSLTDGTRDFGVGVAWSGEVLPHAWLFQEFVATPGFPWYQEARLMAVEPMSAIPAHGLAAAVASNTHQELEPHATAELELAAVFFHAADRDVRRISLDGTVEHAA